MKLLTLELAGYRQFADALRIDVPSGLVGVCGPNGVGKSKLIESIGFALYGPNRRLLPSGDRARDLPSRGKRDARPSVTLRLELRGEVLRIKRTERTATLETEAGAILAETPNGVTRKMTQLLRLSPDAYLGTFVARQREVSRLLALRSSERQRLVNRLIGISQIESAIEIAKDEKGRRGEAAKIAEAAMTISPGDARRLDEEQAAALLESQNALRDAEEERDRLAGNVRDARRAFDEARSANERLQGLHNQLTELDHHKASLTRQRTDAEQRLQQALEAEGDLQVAKSTYAATEGAEEGLEFFELMKQRHTLVGRLDSLGAKSAGREDKLRTMNSGRELQDETNGQIAAARQKIKSAESHGEDAKRRADALIRRRQNAAKLGPDGICDVCGQRYGDSFSTAVAHLDEEAREYQDSAEADAVEVAALKDELMQLEGQAQSLRDELEELAAQVEDLADIPGRIAQSRFELDSINRLLASEPARIEAYDETEHQRTTMAVWQRQQAAGLIERLQPVADERATVRDALDALTASLSDLETRRSDLTSAATEAKEKTALLDAAKAALGAAEATHQTAIDAVTSAARLVSERAALKDQAARQLALATDRAAAASSARRNLVVAERASDVLLRLLTGITEEARPRLAELIDTWGRSLLGSRFRTVDLAEDYGIVADNGSGPHDLSHFSGGEQTVLSVMLRVAISMFCRERAGFDTGFLILDEIFGDQDTEHRTLLVDFLSEIQRHYHQVLVVNHVDDVTAMLDSVIDVIPTGPNTSTAALRS